MQNFHDILFISKGVRDESEGMKQALGLARNNNAPLKILVVCPEFPQKLAQYKEKYEESLAAQVKATIQSTRSALTIRESEVAIDIEVRSGPTPVLNIIREVIINRRDVVIKEPEPEGSGIGFKALDMHLLRKCPCPVWLCRPIKRFREEIRVAVAIDPENDKPGAFALALRLLELSRSLADIYNRELSIVSCWDYDFEEYLRNNSWIKMSAEELLETVVDAQAKHRAALESLIRKSNIGGKNIVHHLRGHAEEIIPAFLAERNVDILVMGTVARTGIPGFIIGNTSENILQKIGCSLLALKPQGFVSPVKGY